MGHGIHITARLLRTAAVAVALCLLAGLACTASAYGDRPVKQKKENRRAESHQIETLEQDWLHALVKGDTATLDKLMADDFLAISANGNLSDKAQYLSRVSDRVNVFSNIDVMDLKVRVQPSAAVVVSQVRVVGQLDGRPVNAVFRYTKVYSRNPAGQWHVLNVEATRVSGLNPDGSEMHQGRPIGGTPISMK